MLIRSAWEARWGRPSRGEPLFEGVSLVQHAIDLALHSERNSAADREAQEETRRANAIAESGGNPFPDLPDLDKWRPRP